MVTASGFFDSYGIDKVIFLRRKKSFMWSHKSVARPQVLSKTLCGQKHEF
jgi:hypothetical protein